MYVAAVIIAAGFVLFYCSYQIRLGAYVRTLCRNRAAGRVVALTFDDGPDPEMTPRVLDLLRERGVRATFFLVGAKAERHPELVRRIAAEGHDTGIHTWEHAAGFPMRSSWAMTADILRCRESLRQIAGVETHLFRPPFGVTNPMIGGMVRRMGYTVIGWSIRSLDTLAGPRSKVVERIRRQLHDGAIILLHDNRTGSPQLAELVLRMLAQEGYEVVRVDKLLNIHAYDNEN